MSMSCAFLDDSFGPYAKHCRGGFDFTLLFQESILSILPLVLLIGIAPLRIVYLIRRSTKVQKSFVLPLKLVRSFVQSPRQMINAETWVGVGSICNMWRPSDCSCRALGGAGDHWHESINRGCGHGIDRLACSRNTFFPRTPKDH